MECHLPGLWVDMDKEGRVVSGLLTLNCPLWLLWWGYVSWGRWAGRQSELWELSLQCWDPKVLTLTPYMTPLASPSLRALRPTEVLQSTSHQASLSAVELYPLIPSDAAQGQGHSCPILSPQFLAG